VPRSAVFYSPHAFFFQGCSSVVLRRLGACGEWALSRLCGRLVVVSQAEADVAVSTCHISRRRLAIVPNGLPDKRFTGLLPRRVARQQFGGGTGVWAAVVGRFSTQKGHDRLLRVLALLPEERRRDLTVFLFGEGEEEPALRRMADELGVSDCLRWPGYVPTVAADLRAFDILFLPSRYEGLSYALLEGLCSGVPVVAADIPANRLTGFGPPALRLASFDDPAGALPVVTEALVSAPMGDPERVASLAREAFSVRRQVDQLLGLYLSGVREAERRA
jgi:glycosyltransferase involved in cell wall biosynthesis